MKAVASVLFACMMYSAVAFNPVQRGVDLLVNQARELAAAGLLPEGTPMLRGERSVLVGSISSCGSASDHAHNLQVTAEPENPSIGGNYTMHTIYDLDETVTGGSATYKGTLSGFPVLNQKDDLCTDLASGDTPCPLSGHIDSYSVTTIPANTPHGTYKGTISWTDQNSQPILCIQFTFAL